MDRLVESHRGLEDLGISGFFNDVFILKMNDKVPVAMLSLPGISQLKAALLSQIDTAGEAKPLSILS